ncbi:FAD/NAD(P)-binding domain-containing protein [Pseudovirgaria hyperparasitica]|uniref:FAD/NAD(P)-binding domain-containing protein n=1 Tax=Pseudovirgaria hyperparasitica TaxID=470096 RepID=A0A6A6VZB5_9PEZI|nr:FAD/NAD(P)-binding domain-containing protein [Pseudovirgaria hyperparasitica]KAF2755030.1 FAD/NAD(P)-binding domain-containing protein [Pseudovirgaria hyperparasitica]
MSFFASLSISFFFSFLARALAQPASSCLGHAVSSPIGASPTTTTVPTPSPTAHATVPVSDSSYDYIVAGAGPAGIIVAERLAESGAEVLLIERGHASTYVSGGRAVVPWNSTVTRYDVPAYADHLSSMSDRSAYCEDTASQAGCILGGGSMVDAMMFVKPQARDFDDNWPDSWKWKDVKGAADRLYTRSPGTSLASMDGERYDQGGFDIVSTFLSRNGFAERNALLEPDAKYETYSYPPWNIQNGRRGGPVVTYLPIAQKLPNFHLSLNTKVVRAVRSGSAVTGVEVETSSGRHIINVKSNGKVILSAGALSTPRILFNSGIGPSDQIQIVASGSSRVPLPPTEQWINLPVGQGLKDHPVFTLKFSTKNTTTALAPTAFTNPSLHDIDLFAQGAGLLSQSSQRLAFWTSVNTTSGSQKFIQGTCSMPSNNTIEMKISLTHGLSSVGSLGITSAGATEFTATPWLNTADDKEAVSLFLDNLLAYSRSDASTLTLQTASDPSTVTSADLITEYVSGSHFVGTAKMGPDDGRANGTAVVDLDTRVYGTDNLFVVDASFHPDLPTGDTQAIVMLAAEAAAARILALGGSSTPVVPAISNPTVSPISTPNPVAPNPPSSPNANNGAPGDQARTSPELVTQDPDRRPNAVKRSVNGYEEAYKSRRPVSLDVVEDEDMVERRIQWERASFLDSYYRDF